MNLEEKHLKASHDLLLAESTLVSVYLSLRGFSESKEQTRLIKAAAEVREIRSKLETRFKVEK